MPEEKKAAGTENEGQAQVQEAKTYTKEELDRTIQSAVETNMKKIPIKFVCVTVIVV